MTSSLDLASKRLALIKEAKIMQARESFWHYRVLMNPGMKQGWFQRDLAGHLQQFYEDLIAGKRPRLLIASPPQHGKSYTAIDFLSWVAGKNPDIRSIFASFSDRLGVRANLRLQRHHDGKIYKEIFPETKINQSNVVTVSGQYLRNREILEYIGKTGYFRNTTCGGAITGEGLDLGLIDDPVKGREEANSETIREKLWQWFTDDFFTRFSEDSGMLMIMTRWHVDDIAGRLMDHEKGALKIISYPAIAETDEQNRKAGDALFPEHKSKDFLLERKSLMLSTSWEALYQQNPVVAEGNMFRPDMIEVIDTVPRGVLRMVRYWDKAGSDDAGAYTAGVLMYALKDGRFLVADVVREQLSSGRREALIKQTAQIDGVDVEVFQEQEPGSGGKESAENTVKNLAGFSIRTERVTGSKIARADPYAVQVEAGNVCMLRKSWNKDYIDEMRLFPNGKYKDQIDASSGAFNKLNAGNTLIFE